MDKIFFGKTDIGLKRSTNQDCFFAQEIEKGRLLCVVCDGMGGANGGSFASSLAVKTFTDYVKEQTLDCENPVYLEILPKALDKANKELFEKSKEDPALDGMGTTLVCALYDSGTYYCISVGDSRIYVFGNGNVQQLSHDHSYVQSLVDSGQITREEARTHPNRNIITKAVGTAEESCGDMFVVNDVKTDGLLLCTDGLSGYVGDDELNRIFNENTKLSDVVDAYIQSAKNAGGGDNITAVAIKNGSL